MLAVPLVRASFPHRLLFGQLPSGGLKRLSTVIHSRCLAVAELSRIGTARARAARSVCHRHSRCPPVTSPGRIGDKWIVGVDNSREVGTTSRRTVLFSGISYPQSGGSETLCVDCHSPGPVGIDPHWGDVDELCTRYPGGKWRRCAAMCRYPHFPHHYDENG